jgi:hypothetical protein
LTVKTNAKRDGQSDDAIPRKQQGAGAPNSRIPPQTGKNPDAQNPKVEAKCPSDSMADHLDERNQADKQENIGNR